MIELVCSVCGSSDLEFQHESPDPTRSWVEQRSVDPRWPIAHCRSHTDKRNHWTPLISSRAFQAKRKAPQQAPPSDLFGDLPDDEKASLAKPVRLL